MSTESGVSSNSSHVISATLLLSFKNSLRPLTFPTPIPEQKNFLKNVSDSKHVREQANNAVSTPMVDVEI